jgi:glycosyltransferase involved in cell wall biosynthesis
MRIGIAGPMDVRMLADLFPSVSNIPKTYSFPLIGQIAREFYNRGHELVLFALSSEVVRTERIDGERIRVYICPKRRPRLEMLDFFRAERRALCDAMRTSGCDVIHAHWTYEFGSAAAESGLPHVVTAHDVPMVVLRFARHPYWMEKPWLAVKALRRAQCVTAVSPYVAQQLQRFLRPQKDVLVIPNGVPPDVFGLGARRARRRGGPIVFASVLNGWGPRKNAKTLIKAFALFRKTQSEAVQLRMFGDGFEKGGPAERWAGERHLDSGIDFIGPLPHSEVLRQLADEVDVLVHPSLEEACCMAVIEAMAIGLPVIGGKAAGGIPWMLDSGHAGLLVNVKSPSSIASGMRTLIEDIQLRTALAQSGRRKALSEYRLESVVVPYENLLARVAQERTH